MGERTEDPTIGARTAVHSRDARLNQHRAPYGEGAWRGESYLVAGGGTAVTPQKPRPRTVPKEVGTDGSLSHDGYGAGVYVPQDTTEHPDIAGFSKLSKRGHHDANNLTARKPGSRGDIDKSHNGYRYAAAGPGYGTTSYAKPVASEASGVAGVHFGTRKGGVSDAKYFPTHNEAVMGYNAVVPSYGQGKFASPVKPMAQARYGYGQPWEQRRDVAGYGAYVAPRSGVY